MPAAQPPAILLIIGGSIAAYKSLDLIRRLRERGANVRVVLTAAATRFITPLAAGALAGSPALTDLFDAASELDVGHIRLAREADLVLVAPATADLLARMAQGHAPDLAAAILLATKAPVLVAPAMNPAMWSHPATTRNVARLLADGIRFIGPLGGEMAESGESGIGRMAEPLPIAEAALALLGAPQTLAGRHVLITAGPTHEPIDPVRYIANRSSGRQGYALAEAARARGARVTLVSGPVALAAPPGIEVIRVESARDMLAATQGALPADLAIMTAAVADWRVAAAGTQKLKKDGSGTLPDLQLVENPDILATVARHPTRRPRLVVGFAAETQNLVAHAQSKLERKGCDVIVANDVSLGTATMGGPDNEVQLVTAQGVEHWPRLPKSEVAARLIDWLAARLG